MCTTAISYRNMLINIWHPYFFPLFFIIQSFFSFHQYHNILTCALSRSCLPRFVCVSLTECMKQSGGWREIAEVSHKNKNPLQTQPLFPTVSLYGNMRINPLIPTVKTKPLTAANFHTCLTHFISNFLIWSLLLGIVDTLLKLLQTVQGSAKQTLDKIL